MLLRKVAEANEFIRINAFDALLTLALKYHEMSLSQFSGIVASSNSVATRLAISKILGRTFREQYLTQDSFIILRTLLHDKDAEVRQESRLAVESLQRYNPEVAKELLIKYFPEGEQLNLALEIIEHGNQEFISPRKLRKK